MTDIYNPWAGLASYEDPATAERKLKFCGRDDDSYDLARLIMGNVFVTLYGKSGIGKTSLLNAGVFPELRAEQYSPDSLRLGIRDDKHPQSYQSMIIEAIGRIVKRTETINVIAEQQDPQAIDYLWNYFARHRFYDKDDEPTTPVFVFDQFEEVFRGHRDEAEILLKQLDYINDKDHALDRCEIDGQTYRYEQNFRFVVSIREDDLYLLEDSIDNCYLPALKRCRYRLRSLSEEGARDAILIPGKGLFNPGEEDAISKSIISKSRNDDGSISTNIISLLCSRIYVDFKKSGENHISPLLVDNFLKGNPFEKFYNEATRGFSDREKSYIEDNFVDSTGRRNSIPESNFLKHVPNGAALLGGDTRILQRTSTSSDGKNNRVELIHDSFCDPLSKQKEKREKRKRLYQLALVSLIAILSLSAIVYVWSINQRMRTNESRVLAEKASALVDQGDSYLARLLALEALPPNRPYTVEAEYALRKASRQNTAILRGHTYDVYSASFSPDGRYIVSASMDTTVRIWDAKTGQQVGNPLVGHTGNVYTASFSPDGRFIVSASCDGTVRLWDAKTGQQVGNPLVRHTCSVWSASFSPDGRYIVYTSSDSTARLWDAQTRQQVGEPLKHPDYVKTSFFSPDSRYIVTVSGKKVWVWDVETGQQVGNTLELESEQKYDYIEDATFSPDGKYIVMASEYGTSTWNAKTGQQIGETLEYEGMLYPACLSPDCKYFVTIARDGEDVLRIWNVETQQQVGSPLKGHSDMVESATFSPDGKYIVSTSSDLTVRIWDANNEQKDGWLLECEAAFLSPDGKYIVTLDSTEARIWDIKTRQQVGNLEEHPYSIWDVSFSPDGKYIVSASNDSTVRIWDAKTGQQVGDPLVGHTAYVELASFSPDGRYIVSASGDSTVSIWDAKTGRQVGNPLKHHDKVYSVSFSPDGRYIRVHLYRAEYKVWDVQTWQQIDDPWYGYPLEYFSPDGKYFISYEYIDGKDTIQDDYYSTYYICDAKTRHLVGKPLVGHTSSINSARFSPDGNYIVTASEDKTVRIWDAKTGLQVGKPLEGHTQSVTEAFFSPDGKYILSFSQEDNTARIWDTKTGLQIDSPIELGYYYASFSPDGRYIITESSSGVRIWDFPPLQELIDSTRERFKNRPLTPEERRKYYLE